MSALGEWLNHLKRVQQFVRPVLIMQRALCMLTEKLVTQTHPNFKPISSLSLEPLTEEGKGGPGLYRKYIFKVDYLKSSTFAFGL